MSESSPLPSDLPAGLRARFVSDINGLRMHILEAGSAVLAAAGFRGARVPLGHVRRRARFRRLDCRLVPVERMQDTAHVSSAVTCSRAPGTGCSRSRRLG